MPQITISVAASSDDVAMPRDGVLPCGQEYDDTFDILTLKTRSLEGIESYIVGLRFLNVAVPNGARIDAASLRVSSSDPKTDWIATLRAEAADDPPTFTQIDGPHARTMTPAGAPWSGGTVDGDWSQSPEIRSMIQEVVDRGGWSAGNALVLLLDSDSLPMGITQGFRSYDYGLEYAPQLAITYSLPKSVNPIHLGMQA